MSVAILRSDPVPRRSAVKLERSEGEVDLVFDSSDSYSRAYQRGSLKVRFPKSPQGTPPQAVLMNMTGGLTGGDTLDIKVMVEPRAVATVTSQAYERIYRSSGEDATIRVSLDVKADATLFYLPQPTLLFEGFRLARETVFNLEPGASVLAVEGLVFGRAAMNETLHDGTFTDAVFAHIAGRLVHADRFALSGDIQSFLDKPTVLDGRRAMATLRYLAPGAAREVDAVRALLEDAESVAAASAWDDMLIARFAAPDGYTLHKDLCRVLSAWHRRETLPRIWTF